MSKRKAPAAGPATPRSTSLGLADTAIALLLGVVAVASRTRLQGNHVLFDEAHVGRFAAMYLNGTFIHDVHPPLGKLLVAAVQWVAGHNGTYMFGSGEEYPAWVDYQLMRGLVSVFGAMAVPVAFLTCRRVAGAQWETAVLAAVFVCFDNALCLMSSIMVLDGMVLLATALVLLCMSDLKSTRGLVLTGAALGVAVSIKWIGVFSIGLVGFVVLADLHRNASCLWRANRLWTWIAGRGLALAVLPLAIYVAVFRVHFALQTQQGLGEHLMPIRFQAQLRFNRYNRQPSCVAYGGIAKMFPDGRETPDMMLQSTRADSTLPGSPQAVGCGHVLTGADWWAFEHPAGAASNDTEVVFLGHGSVVRLKNDLSSKYLFANSSAVSGDEGAQLMVLPLSAAEPRTDSLEWVVEMPAPANAGGGAYHNRWRVEFQVDLRQGFGGDMSQLVAFPFVSSFVAQNAIMARTNNELVSDPDRYDALASAPWSWPFLVYPMRMSSRWQGIGAGDSTESILHYEVGNPLLWWASALLCCVVCPLRAARYCCMRRRDAHLTTGPTRNAGGYTWDLAPKTVLWLGWATHYLPFFLMGRVTYLHHYLPALYFALLLLAAECGDLLAGLGRWRRAAGLAGIAMLTMAVFWQLRQCTFGWKSPTRGELAKLRWLATWNIAGDKHDMDV
ncbi:Protein O-mannosyltransferase 2 [Coemansia thaxteri]|uniref:Dolichyl-phosphate-mannose--protein mannosyltransferase n=1 Tax=Coemansia thaxteri TaxID=2663907 RepID=A0A9W8BGC6_9FUNG|nr:Protein O-mannosyltransferase 2 [Coemansia thaxteri]